MMERWLPVVGYEGLYEVSDQGRVRSLSRRVHNYTKAGRILKPGRKLNKNGRLVALQVMLGRGNTRRVHNLVLEAFVSVCPAGLEGCHNDGDPSHNILSNLRWDTHAANMADQVLHGTKANPPVWRRGSNVRTWLNDDEVRCIQAEPYFPGVNQMLGRAFGISYKTASRIRSAA